MYQYHYFKKVLPRHYVNYFEDIRQGALQSGSCAASTLCSVMDEDMAWSWKFETKCLQVQEEHDFWVEPFADSQLQSRDYRSSKSLCKATLTCLCCDISMLDTHLLWYGRILCIQLNTLRHLIQLMQRRLHQTAVVSRVGSTLWGQLPPNLGLAPKCNMKHELKASGYRCKKERTVAFKIRQNASLHPGPRSGSSRR